MRSLTLIIIRNASKIFGGPLHGTEYALAEACKKCGTGAVQIGPLFLVRTRLPKWDIFSTLNDDILLTSRVADALRSAGIACLVEAVNAESRKPLPLWQLVPEATLPPFTGNSTGYVRERPCEVCNRDGYFGIPHVPIVLKYEGLPHGLGSKDLLCTFERFGNSRLRSPFRDSVFAAPLYVASARLVEVLKKEKVKGVDFEPLHVE